MRECFYGFDNDDDDVIENSNINIQGSKDDEKFIPIVLKPTIIRITAPEEYLNLTGTVIIMG